MARRTALLAAAAIAALPLVSGCDALECGPGTIEDNGTCVVADGQSPADVEACGLGTKYDPSTQTCAPLRPPTECGANTDPIVNEDGVTVCEGSGGAQSCDSPISCPPPSGGKVSVCGQLFDVETGTPIRAGTPAFADCNPAAPAASGPCALKVAFYDPLAFAGDTSTMPQTTDQVRLDDCGRFAGVNIARPFNGFLAVAVDDAGAADNRRLTGVAFSIATNERRVGVRAFSAAFATDAKWTSSAGNPFGAQSLVDRGVFLPVYYTKHPAEGGTPVAGVQIRASGMAADGVGTFDFYFGDTDRTIRSTIDPAAEATGANGAGLMVGTSLTQHSGLGGEPQGCVWPSNLAAAIPGVVLVREEALQVQGANTPCPGT
jgi:hypothetical protein